MKNKMYVIVAIVVVLLALLPFFNEKQSLMNENPNAYDGTVVQTGDAYNYEDKSAMLGRGEETNSVDRRKLSMDEDRKVIYEYAISLNTEKFDEVRDSVHEQAKARKGFIESMEVSGTEASKDRNVHFQVRIPSDEAESYFATIKALGEVTHESKSSDDVTRYYHDTEIEIKNLQKAEERYLTLYEKAETIEEMLLLENEISRIRTQIDIKTASLKGYDYRVSFTLFHILLTEVVKEKPSVHVEPTMWDRAVSGFVNTINFLIKFAQDTVVLLITMSPVVAIVLVLAFLIWIGYLIFRKKASKKLLKDSEKK